MKKSKANENRKYNLKEITDKLGKYTNNSLATEKSFYVQFSPARKIIQLDLRNFIEIPKDICAFSHLKTLRLFHYGNNILPSWIEEFQNLQEIFIQNSNLEYLPEEFYSLLNLKRVYIYSTQLKELDCKIDQLKNLLIFDIQSSKISKLPPTIGNLSELEHLTLAYSDFNEIPQNFSKLENLTTFSISGSNLDVFPIDIILSMEKLIRFSISDTKILNLPIELQTHPTLRTITFSPELIEKNPLKIKSKVLVPWKK